MNSSTNNPIWTETTRTICFRLNHLQQVLDCIGGKSVLGASVNHGSPYFLARTHKRTKVNLLVLIDGTQLNMCGNIRLSVDTMSSGTSF
eukprot:m.217690 g.217690  ORF g.217690 m.217690 type:complete len:89 (-) comp13812_c0_seq16:3854-4120(-)